MKNTITRPFFITLLIVFVISACVKEKTTDRKSVLRVMKYQEEAWNKGNIEGFMDGYWKSDSLKFVGKNGITYGWKQTLANYKKNYSTPEQMGKLKFSINSIYPEGNMTFVLGTWEIKRSQEKIGGYFTLLWKKINGKWMIIIDHTS